MCCVRAIPAIVASLLLMMMFGSSIYCQSSTTATALFVFGDSLSDDGNNNYISSFAKSNYPPYGIDFPSGPTGRFCNGRIVVDFLAQFLGLPLIPAFLDPTAKGVNVLKGVNYASAAGGILEETGFNYGSRISLSEQIKNFQTTIDQISPLLGSPAAVKEHLAKAIFALELGSNDYINNYLNPFFFSSSRRYSPQAFSALLLTQYSQQLTTLYKMGARKFLVSAIGPLGCIPEQLALASSNGHCIESINDLVQTFNGGLKSLLVSLNRNLTGATFVFCDNYKAVRDIIKNPTLYGFNVVNEGCCGFGRFKGQITCIVFVRPCTNRNEYVFWDAFHPTEAVNLVLATKALHGQLSHAFPMNLSQLLLI